MRAASIIRSLADQGQSGFTVGTVHFLAELPCHAAALTVMKVLLERGNKIEIKIVAAINNMITVIKYVLVNHNGNNKIFCTVPITLKRTTNSDGNNLATSQSYCSVSFHISPTILFDAI